MHISSLTTVHFIENQAICQVVCMIILIPLNLQSLYVELIHMNCTLNILKDLIFSVSYQNFLGLIEATEQGVDDKKKIEETLSIL